MIDKKTMVRIVTANYHILLNRIEQEDMEEIAPVIHAHKVRAHSQGGGTHWVVCSNCEKPIDWQDAYCKHCGAIMDEEVNDD